MKRQQKILAECFPLLSWDPPFLVSKRGDLTCAYVLELPSTYSLSVPEYDNLHALWVRALRVLPAYSLVHRQDIYFFSEADVVPQSASFLEQASARHFAHRPYLQQESYLFLTLTSKQALRGNSLASLLCANRVVPPEQLDEQRVHDFQDAVSQFVQILAEGKVQARALTETELLGTPQRLGVIEQYMHLQFQPASGVLCDHITSKGAAHESDFQVGDAYLGAFALHSLDALPTQVQNYRPHPVYSEGDWVLPVDYLHGLGRELPFPHIVQTVFFLEDPQEVVAELEKKGREQASLSQLSRQNALHHQCNEAYVNEAIAHAQQPVRMGVHLWLWDEEKSRLQQKKAQLSAQLFALDACPSKVEGILPVLFWSGIPGAASSYPYEMTSLTFASAACCFLMQEGMPNLSIFNGGIRLCERLSGVPLSVDLSEEPLKKGIINNRNKFILGPSGSGKSFFTNHLMRQYYDQGAHVLIVDVGDSYQGLCTLIQEETGGKDGLYFSYTQEHPITFNPFLVGKEGYSIEKREQLAALIFCLWKNESETITKAEETHIAAALDGFIKGIEQGRVESVNFNAFYTYLQGPFTESLQAQGVERCHFDVENLLQVLRPYAAGGMYEFLLNAPTGINLENQRFIVFEIDTIKDHKTLFPVVTLIIMDTFISKMRLSALAQQKKVILMEEAWKAISKTGTAEFIKYLFKTVRKHLGEAIVVTQELEDIVGNPVVKNSILSNADCKILLDQRKYANRFSEVQSLLGLRDAEVPLALSLNLNLQRQLPVTSSTEYARTLTCPTPLLRNRYKEVFISLNGQVSSVYGVEVSAEEYWVYTTEKKEKAALWKVYQEGGSFQQAVQKMVGGSL